MCFGIVFFLPPEMYTKLNSRILLTSVIYLDHIDMCLKCVFMNDNFVYITPSTSVILFCFEFLPVVNCVVICYCTNVPISFSCFRINVKVTVFTLYPLLSVTLIFENSEQVISTTLSIYQLRLIK